MGRGLPYMQFFPNDWRGEDTLAGVSLAGRGLWLEMMCLMWNGTRRGYLVDAEGKAMPVESVAKKVHAGIAEVEGLFEELEKNGVYSKTDEGVIYCRRMAREQDLRERKNTSKKRIEESKRTISEGYAKDKRRISERVGELVGDGQSESEAESEAKAEGVPPPVLDPTLKQVLDHAVVIGCPPDSATRFWNHYEALGWRVSGQRMHKWQAKLANWKIEDQARAASGKNSAQKAGGGGTVVEGGENTVPRERWQPGG